jgi:hypothetical protein
MSMKVLHDGRRKPKPLSNVSDVLIITSILHCQGSKDSVKGFLQVKENDTARTIQLFLMAQKRSEVMNAKVDRNAWPASELLIL